MKQYRNVAILCWTAAAMIIMYALFGCARTYEPIPEGKETNAPLGYTSHCIEFPDSIFCKDRDK